MTKIQKISMTIAVFSLLAASSTQLTDIFAPFGSIAPTIVKEIVSIAGFASGILGVVLTFTTGQASQVQAVQDMPGIETIRVNKNATPALAALAVDPSNTKIQPTPQDKQAVQATAAAAS